MQTFNRQVSIVSRAGKIHASTCHDRVPHAARQVEILSVSNCNFIEFTNTYGDVG